MRASDVESYLIRRVAELGGEQVKHTSPGTAGEPDRLIKLPGYPAALLELKCPGKAPRPHQEARLARWQGGWHAGRLCELAR